MKRKLLLALLGCGSVAGYAFGFAWCSHQGGRSLLTEQVAQACVEAALKSQSNTHSAPVDP